MGLRLLVKVMTARLSTFYFMYKYIHAILLWIAVFK